MNVKNQRPQQILGLNIWSISMDDHQKWGVSHGYPLFSDPNRHSNFPFGLADLRPKKERPSPLPDSFFSKEERVVAVSKDGLDPINYGADLCAEDFLDLPDVIYIYM